MVVSHGSTFEEEEKDDLDQPKGSAGWKNFQCFCLLIICKQNVQDHLDNSEQATF